MRLFKRIHEQQGGQILVLALIILSLSGMMVVPLLSLMNTGIKTTQVYQRNAQDVYAADAGIQKALWDIQNDSTITSDQKNNVFGNTYNYPDAFTINNNSVTYSITYVWLLSGIVNLTTGQTPHAQWLDMAVGGAASPSGAADLPGTYTMTFTYNETGNKKIDTMGVWLPHGFTYVSGSSGYPAFNNIITTAEPAKTSVWGGTSLVWNVQPNFSFQNLSPPTATMKFQYLPGNCVPAGAASWVKSQSQDIGYQWDNALWWYKITSTATDLSNNETTTIKSLVVNNNSNSSLTVVTYQINPS